MEKIKLGISSCLLGEQVRYDGKQKLDKVLINNLKKYAEFVSVCPEVECGLGVPRKPMRLEGSPAAPQLIVTETGEDLTQRMDDFARKKMLQLEKEGVCGFIFKSNSPSCGKAGVNIYNENSMPVGTGAGIFAGIFVKHFPLLPVEDEEHLHDPGLRENFMEKIFAFAKSCTK